VLSSISSRFGSRVVYPSPNERLHHWSVALAGRQRGEKKWQSLLLRKKIKPGSKDMFYVEMFWIVQGTETVVTLLLKFGIFVSNV